MPIHPSIHLVSLSVSLLQTGWGYSIVLLVPFTQECARVRTSYARTGNSVCVRKKCVRVEIIPGFTFVILVSPAVSRYGITSMLCMALVN